LCDKNDTPKMGSAHARNITIIDEWGEILIYREEGEIIEN
jgi:hypothetical protein